MMRTLLWICCLVNLGLKNYVSLELKKEKEKERESLTGNRREKSLNVGMQMGKYRQKKSSC